MHSRIRHLLNHRATIAERNAAEHGVDRLGHHEETFLPPKAEGVPCFAQSTTINEMFNERSFGVVDQQWMIWFQPDADIGESDRITEIRSKIGNIVIAENLDVTGVTPEIDGHGRVDHLEVTAFAFRSGVTVQWQASS